MRQEKNRYRLDGFLVEDVVERQLAKAIITGARARLVLMLGMRLVLMLEEHVL